MQYDPTGTKHVLTKLETEVGTYELKIWASTNFVPYIYVGLYIDGLRLSVAEMDCQEGLVTSELWAGFKRRLMEQLEKVSVTEHEKSHIEKIWDLVAQIKMVIIDGHLSAEIPDYVE